MKFNESDSYHETYYNQVRKALITVNEQWFRPEDGRITVVSGGEEKKVTELDWVKTDQGYQSEILFEGDGMMLNDRVVRSRGQSGEALSIWGICPRHCEAGIVH